MSSSISDLGALAAVLGAAFALTGLLGEAGTSAGLGIVLLGVFLTASHANAVGGEAMDLWRGLCISGLIAFAGLGISYAIAAVGGILLAVGCIGAVAAGSFQFRLRAEGAPDSTSA